MQQQRGIFYKIDWTIVIIYMVLVIFGWVNIYAAVYDENHTSIMDIGQRYGKQMIWIAAAIIMILATLLLDPKLFSQFLVYAGTVKDDDKGDEHQG